MRKTLLAGTAILTGLVLTAGALAADTKPSAEMKSGAQIQSDGKKSSGGASAQSDPGAKTQMKSDADESSASGSASFGYRSFNKFDTFEGEIADGRSAQDLIGKDLKDPNGDTVGEISDLLIDENNRIERVLVDVGGFLGIGEKRVALELSELQPIKDGFVVQMTEEQLEKRDRYIESDDRWVPYTKRDK